VLYGNNVIYYKYVDIEAAAAKPKISFLSNFPIDRNSLFERRGRAPDKSNVSGDSVH
jgi:hypothetical protein